VVGDDTLDPDLQAKAEQSVRDGVKAMAGKHVVAVGYGWVGKGIAKRARGLGAQVTVIELGPRLMGRAVPARVAAHNAGRGARYTRSRRPVELVHTERKKSQSTALRREADVLRAEIDAFLSNIRAA